MKNLFKILSITILIPLIVINFFFGSANLIEGKNFFFPYADTEFSASYTPKKFDNIKNGQTIDEVDKILGKPLYKNIDSLNNSIEYVYTNDGKLMKNKREGDLAWYYSAIQFDNKKKVSKIEKHWVFD
ncbi:hypothetical protein AB670_01860 [Chryseobacterium sp. MOF25P]|nr:outer membrane protein assembly factor BamE [Chryseobacterium sp. BGARF1]OBW41733.1 hypothetical protein AB670_01860 [Chryseobacterium sp. MOF25P]OBW46895.1 hypothetical protein AB671_00990 [Chryseobacterium sp. BGARF1]